MGPEPPPSPPTASCLPVLRRLSNLHRVTQPTEKKVSLPDGIAAGSPLAELFHALPLRYQCGTLLRPAAALVL